ncbi:MAG: hypothetical protein L0I95_13495 [Tetragenococcus koreensis]|nr:hypothetical protein [Tetragenococcus koreensis]MDN6606470.1 hypothetical protein [Tetragenococcus halophilus]MDN6146067.1 hypothetical protein [Tetragenococcus koreensis]MDN6497325.1 hypothetical protein [Tetragenococcus koreensis]MDN6579987.1 hypothetical protein [Tetragenococcus koreensis]
MNKEQAIKEARTLAKATLKSRKDAEEKHKRINELFKQFDLTWFDID